MISDFRFRCMKVLPTVYDDSLSYYEVLCKISLKLNEVIKQLNEYDPEGVVQRVINEKLEEYTQTVLNPSIDSAIAPIDTRISNLELLVANNYEELDARVRQNADEILSIKTDVARINVALEDLRGWVSVQLGLVYDAINRMGSVDREYTDAKIAKLILSLPVLTNVIVQSPVDGNYKSVQDALWDMYDAMRWGALTARQYDTMYLTAQEYDNRGLTAFEYDVYGIQKLLHWLLEYRLHSGYTGEWVKTSQAIHENTQALRVDGISAGAYDAREDTAQTYDERDITAFVYDWNFVNII